MNTTDTTLFDFTEETAEWDGVFKVVQCRRALSPSGMDQIDYALNPYGGCEHGCIYCFGPAITHTEQSEWRIVRVKSNIADRLSKELPAVEGTIGIGTVTDAYQAAEGRFKLTKRCLEILSDKERKIHIHTKSDLILRDKELIASMDSMVGVTITSIDDRISKISEPGAPLPTARLNALTELLDAGVDAYALLAPIMSPVEGHEQDFMDILKETGVRKVCVSALHKHNVDTSRLERLDIVDSPDAQARIMSIGRGMGMDIRLIYR